MKAKLIPAALFFVLSICGYANAIPTATVNSLRQLWPWSSKTVVDFTVTGLPSQGLFNYALSAYDGTNLLGEIPSQALSDKGLVACDGDYSVEFDPEHVNFLTDLKLIQDFNVRVTVSDDAVLYAVIDLSKNATDAEQLTFIRSSELKSGAFGAWTMGSTFHTGPLVDARWQDTPVWTGVTNDPTYATTKLVMRHIPAGTFTMGSPADELFRVATYEPQCEVTVTKGFFIGVFAFTSAQWACAYGESSSSLKPKGSVSYNALRGASNTVDAVANVNWPATGSKVAPDSYLSLLRTKTGLLFDLPTSAQWEYACRAGTTGAWNNGTTATNAAGTGDSEIRALAWFYVDNGGDASYATYELPVGGKLPNGWGLYDFHGNMNEMCLDWQNISHFNNSPREGDRGDDGPLFGQYNKRIVRGGSWRTSYSACRSAYTGAFQFPDGSSNLTGFRMVFVP